MILLIKRFTVQSTLLIACLSLFSINASAMTSPDDVVKNTVNSMVENLRTNRVSYENDNQALYKMLDETLLPVLHVKRMADLILGKKIAQKASQAQKDEFVTEFKALLLQTYASGLLSATGEEKVVYEPIDLAPGADKVKVKAMLITASGEEFPITLFMSNRRDTSWRAYNLDVAGIDFIRTYRSTFKQTLKEKGIDGLIADLRSKNAL